MRQQSAIRNPQSAIRQTFLPFSPPFLGVEEIDEVVSTLRSDWITTGPRTRQFEVAFAEFLGAPGALGLNSCTAGLHTALATLGVGPGDDVITTPMTFSATVNVVEHVGAHPVLVDVEPDTLNIDPEQIARQAARRAPRAIIPVHYTGHPCEMDRILDLARQHGAHVVEDAAHALPARYRGRLIGTLGDLTAFSLYATKNLTTAEGGMLTATPELLEQARILSLHGMSHDAWNRYSEEGSWYYEVVAPGFKYNMTDIAAAIGIHQLRKLPRFQARRREIVRRYHQAFTPCEALQVPTERPEVEHAWHLYVLRLNLECFDWWTPDGPPGLVRKRFLEQLTARKIGNSVHFIPIHLHPYYRDRYGYRPEDFPVAYREYQRIVSLPLYPRMSDQDVDDVIEAVLDIVDQHRR
ncbi:MAG: DegT/DnrJ/EryC1/StrS aminotransferase family protein [Chloroflexi bacterium]|nr:DegT/DnrJ/EryC1/StrS aminotransferase family protein [Chloroflexota bacterium]